jgi:hypothetical protein
MNYVQGVCVFSMIITVDLVHLPKRVNLLFWYWRRTVLPFKVGTEHLYTIILSTNIPMRPVKHTFLGTQN